MSCSCIKKNFNVVLESIDCKNLLYTDISIWMDGVGFSGKPDTYNVDITLKSLKITKSLELSTDKKNVITSKQLIGRSKCLPDDIYCISVTSCGVKYTIHRAMLCDSRCKIDVLLSKAKTDRDFDDVVYLESIYEAVVVNAKIGKVDIAESLLKILKTKLKDLTCGMC